MKYDFLSDNSLITTDFKEISTEEPNYFFVPKNTESLTEYENGVLTSDLFISQSMGITSARDSFVVDFEKKELKSRIIDFCNREIDTIIFKQNINLMKTINGKLPNKGQLFLNILIFI